MNNVRADMRGMQEVRRAPMIVTHILSSGSAFATRGDTGDRVYIPPRVATASGIEVGGSYDANLIDNKYSEDNSVEFVPHVAVFIFPYGDKTQMLEQLLRRVEEGETTVRDARILRTIFEDMRLIPAA